MRVKKENVKDALMSCLFGLCQPDRGDVFSWIDDRSDEIAELIVKSLNDPKRDEE